MNHKFDQLAKGLAQSTTRRQALKRFGVSLAGMALACFGLANKAEAGWDFKSCMSMCKHSGFSNDQCKQMCSAVIHL